MLAGSMKVLVFALSTYGLVAAFTSNTGILSTGRRTASAPVALRASTLEEAEQTKREETTKNSWGDRVANSGVASAAAVATAAVNAAVAMKALEAPNVDKSYIAMDSSKTETALDEDGLPLRYDKDLIQQYWSKERGALNQRWGYFVGKAVPFLTKLVTLFIRDGKISEKEIPALSKQARIDLQDLGPTFIKAGQMMSVRPDVLPQATLDELTKLQDSVEPFDTSIAVKQIETELGGPLGQFFTSISEEPVAAASLAQVYLATLNDGNNTRVAVKVQRPSVLGTVSKDLYVLRRAAEVFQGLVERFAPQQRTNYVDLLNEWSIGFYTELDFNNEAQNQERLRNALIERGIKGVTVPKVYHELCTRRILVSEWMDGIKLSDASSQEVARVTPLAQEAFLEQLFGFGDFHADPHPGNMLLLREPTPEGHELALIDCGLMARINKEDQDHMISAVIHLANKDYASLVDDFMNLKILPPDSDRAAIIPLMDKALSPYVKGGGAKKYEEELKKLYGMEDGSTQAMVGGFQAMTQDALTVLNDIPFSIPPYFAILGRAIVTLEGVALTGNPDYGIIMEAYPFIARKLLRDDRPEIQTALQEVLYTSSDGESSGLKLSRLLALLNNAAGAVAKKEGAAFVDLDAIPEDGITFKDGLKFLLSNSSESLRNLLEDETDKIVDILSRQVFRKGVTEAVVGLTPPRPPSLPFIGDIFPASPRLDQIPFPIVLPATANKANPGLAIVTMEDLTESIAPKLSQQEELLALSIADAATEFFGEEVGSLLKGDSIFSRKTAEFVVLGLKSGLVEKSVAAISNEELVVAVARAASNLVAGLQSGDESSQRLERDLTEALESLDDAERANLDKIVSELSRNAIDRFVARLSTIERVV